jgi:hypothetical protein
VCKAGLQHVYGTDTKGRQLELFTVHSLRHIRTFFTILLSSTIKF